MNERTDPLCCYCCCCCPAAVVVALHQLLLLLCRRLLLLWKDTIFHFISFSYNNIMYVHTYVCIKSMLYFRKLKFKRFLSKVYIMFVLTKTWFCIISFVYLSPMPLPDCLLDAMLYIMPLLWSSNLLLAGILRFVWTYAAKDSGRNGMWGVCTNWPWPKDLWIFGPDGSWEIHSRPSDQQLKFHFDRHRIRSIRTAAKGFSKSPGKEDGGNLSIKILSIISFNPSTIINAITQIQIQNRIIKKTIFIM